MNNLNRSILSTLSVFSPVALAISVGAILASKDEILASKDEIIAKLKKYRNETIEKWDNTENIDFTIGIASTIIGGIALGIFGGISASPMVLPYLGCLILNHVKHYNYFRDNRYISYGVTAANAWLVYMAGSYLGYTGKSSAGVNASIGIALIEFMLAAGIYGYKWSKAADDQKKVFKDGIIKHGVKFLTTLGAVYAVKLFYSAGYYLLKEPVSYGTDVNSWLYKKVNLISSKEQTENFTRGLKVSYNFMRCNVLGSLSVMIAGLPALLSEAMHKRTGSAMILSRQQEKEPLQEKFYKFINIKSVKIPKLEWGFSVRDLVNALTLVSGSALVTGLFSSMRFMNPDKSHFTSAAGRSSMNYAFGVLLLLSVTNRVWESWRDLDQLSGAELKKRFYWLKQNDAGDNNTFQQEKPWNKARMIFQDIVWRKENLRLVLDFGALLCGCLLLGQMDLNQSHGIYTVSMILVQALYAVLDRFAFGYGNNSAERKGIEDEDFKQGLIIIFAGFLAWGNPLYMAVIANALRSILRGLQNNKEKILQPEGLFELAKKTGQTALIYENHEDSLRLGETKSNIAVVEKHFASSVELSKLKKFDATKAESKDKKEKAQQIYVLRFNTKIMQLRMKSWETRLNVELNKLAPALRDDDRMAENPREQQRVREVSDLVRSMQAKIQGLQGGLQEGLEGEQVQDLKNKAKICEQLLKCSELLELHIIYTLLSEKGDQNPNINLQALEKEINNEEMANPVLGMNDDQRKLLPQLKTKLIEQDWKEVLEKPEYKDKYEGIREEKDKSLVIQLYMSEKEEERLRAEQALQEEVLPDEEEREGGGGLGDAEGGGEQAQQEALHHEQEDEQALPPLVAVDPVQQQQQAQQAAVLPQLAGGGDEQALPPRFHQAQPPQFHQAQEQQLAFQALAEQAQLQLEWNLKIMRGEIGSPLNRKLAQQIGALYSQEMQLAQPPAFHQVYAERKSQANGPGEAQQALAIYTSLREQYLLRQQQMILQQQTINYNLGKKQLNEKLPLPSVPKLPQLILPRPPISQQSSSFVEDRTSQKEYDLWQERVMNSNINPKRSLKEWDMSSARDASRI